MRAALDSPWGRLFENWEQLTPDANGFPAGRRRAGRDHARRHARVQTVIGILGTCIEGSARVCQPPKRRITPAERPAALKDSRR